MILFTVFLESIRLAVGTVFLISALGKLRDLQGFLNGVIAYQVLAVPVAKVYALLLIPLEGLVATSLLLQWNIRMGTLLALILMVSFGFAIASNISKGRNLPCYCFGSRSAESISPRSLARIGLLMTGTVLVSVGEFSNIPIQVEVYSVQAVLWKVVLSLFVLILGTWVLTLPNLFRLLNANLDKPNIN